MPLLLFPVTIWNQTLPSEFAEEGEDIPIRIERRTANGGFVVVWSDGSTSVEPLQSFVGEDGTVTEPVIDHLTEQERIDLGIDDQAEEETQDQEQEQLTRGATPTEHMTSQFQTNTTTHKSNNASINMSGGQITINFAPPS
jgi:hypothetical protein